MEPVIIFLPMRQFVFFNSAGKFFLVHGLRQLTWDTKINVICLQTSLTP